MPASLVEVLHSHWWSSLIPHGWNAPHRHCLSFHWVQVAHNNEMQSLSLVQACRRYSASEGSESLSPCMDVSSVEVSRGPSHWLCWSMDGCNFRNLHLFVSFIYSVVVAKSFLNFIDELPSTNVLIYLFLLE